MQNDEKESRHDESNPIAKEKRRPLFLAGGTLVVFVLSLVRILHI